jgi:hypothetical protein
LGAGAFEIRPITMGSPRVGDGDFADDFDLKLGGLTDQSTKKSCRFVAEGENDLGESVEDLVTQVPLDDVPGFDYKHVITKVLVDFGDEECTLTGKEGNIPCHAIAKYFEAISTMSSQQAADFSVTTGTVDESSLRTPALAQLVLETRPQVQQSSIFSTIFSSTTGIFSSSSSSSSANNAGGSSTSAASSLNGGLNLFLVVVTLFACVLSML